MVDVPGFWTVVATRGPNQARERAPGHPDNAEKYQKRRDTSFGGHLRVGVVRTEPRFLSGPRVSIDLVHIGREVSQANAENRMCQRNRKALAERVLPLQRRSGGGAVDQGAPNLCVFHTREGEIPHAQVSGQSRKNDDVPAQWSRNSRCSPGATVMGRQSALSNSFPSSHLFPALLAQGKPHPPGLRGYWAPVKDATPGAFDAHLQHVQGDQYLAEARSATSIVFSGSNRERGASSIGTAP